MPINNIPKICIYAFAIQPSQLNFNNVQIQNCIFPTKIKYTRMSINYSTTAHLHQVKYIVQVLGKNNKLLYKHEVKVDHNKPSTTILLVFLLDFKTFSVTFDNTSNMHAFTLQLVYTTRSSIFRVLVYKLPHSETPALYF